MFSSSPNRARQGRRLSIGKLGTEGEVEAHRLMGARCAAWSALSEESLEPPSPQTPYTAGAKVKVVVGTWNLGDVTADGDLTAWLRPGADLYAVGCQESGLNPLSALSPLNPAFSGNGPEHWFGLVESTVRAGSEHDAWCRVGTASLGNIHVIVLCTRALFPEVSNVETASEAMGVGGVFPNKGMVAVSLRLGSTPLCFVNGHLAAHEGMAAKRNANLHEMERALRLGCAAPHASLFDLSQRFAHCFLFGDLNYRIDLPFETALRLVHEAQGLGLGYRVRVRRC